MAAGRGAASVSAGLGVNSGKAGAESSSAGVGEGVGFGVGRAVGSGGGGRVTRGSGNPGSVGTLTIWSRFQFFETGSSETVGSTIGVVSGPVTGTRRSVTPKRARSPTTRPTATEASRSRPSAMRPADVRGRRLRTRPHPDDTLLHRGEHRLATRERLPGAIDRAHAEGFAPPQGTKPPS